MPESLQTAETAALRSRAAELAWIAWDLRNAPVVDDALLAWSIRMQSLSPAIPRGPKLLDEIQPPQTGREEPRREPGALAGCLRPNRRLLGLPVEWLNGFRGIDPGQTLDKAL